MGSTMSGARAGGQMGVFYGGVVGVYAGFGTASTFGAGAGIAVGTLVGIPCAVVGAAIGSLGGAAVAGGCDLADGTTRLAAVCSQELERAREGRARTNSRTSQAGVAGGRVAGLPVEALPLLCALVVAKSRGVLSEEQALRRAMEFAACCAEQETQSDVLKMAEARGREVLTFVKLCECYPAESQAHVEMAAKRLAIEADPDTLDAAWIAVGHKPLHEWHPDIRRALPRCAAEIRPELLDWGLQAKYQTDRNAMISKLQEWLPGGSVTDYADILNTLKQKLPKSSFWKAHHLLLQGNRPESLQGLSFHDLNTPQFEEAMRSYLAGSFALCTRSFATGVASHHNSSTGTALMRHTGHTSQALVAAAAQAQFQLAPVEALSPSWQLEVDVLSVEGLRAPEYRLGDLTTGLLRKKPTLHPYVEVCCDSEEGSEGVQTKVVEAKGGNAKIGESLRIPISGLAALRTLELKISVYDARGMQSLIRGDPLIGRGSLALNEMELACPKVQSIAIMRNGAAHGQLKIRTGVRVPENTYKMLADSGARPLAHVALALGNVLAQPEGVDAVLRALPPGLENRRSVDEALLRKLVQRWIIRLNAEAHCMVGFSDEVALLHFSRMVRSAQHIIALCASATIDGGEIQELTVAWVRNLFQICLGTEGPPPALHEARLRRLLAVSVLQGDNPENQLEDMGARLPAGLSLDVVKAVAARLKEADETQEYEMFTGEQIMVGGRVASGMAAVVRLTRSSPSPHVFLYDFEAIKAWVQQSGQDPNTREHIDLGNILPLSAPGPMLEGGVEMAPQSVVRRVQILSPVVRRVQIPSPGAAGGFLPSYGRAQPVGYDVGLQHGLRRSRGGLLLQNHDAAQPTVLQRAGLA